MKIAFGCDHAGYTLKDAIIKHLTSRGDEVVDLGTDSERSCHYPTFACAVAEKVQAGECDFGILVCGTGIGMSLVANKHRGIRAACCSDTFTARLTREHNDSNVLCFGARVVGEGLAIDLVDAFLDAKYANSGNHITRLDMISKLENENFKN